MELTRYKEKKPHGSFGFSVGYYWVDISHPQYIMPMHWHTESELIYIVQGSALFKLDGHEFPVTAGDVLYIDSGVLHSCLPESCTYACLVFDLHMLKGPDAEASAYIEQLLEHETRLPAILTAADNTELAGIVQQIIKTMQNPRPGYQLSVKGGLFQALSLLFWQEANNAGVVIPRTDTRQIRLLKKVLRFIRSNYMEKITLQDLSREAAMSPKYFCRFFSFYTERTPIDYLNHYRVEQAGQMLLTSGRSVTETAFECGFNDMSYFVRCFKKYKNVTPGQYAKSISAG